jgi:hypothetical protein
MKTLLSCVGLTLDQVSRWYTDFLSQILTYSDPVSFVALDSDSGAIAGAIINLVVDPQKPPPPNMKTFLDTEKEPVKIQIATFLEDLEHGNIFFSTLLELSSKWSFFIAFLYQLIGLDICAALNQPSSTKILACLFLSVAENQGGKGIAKELVAVSESKAKTIQGVKISMVHKTVKYLQTNVGNEEMK